MTDEEFLEIEQLRKALREEQMRSQILLAQLGGYEAACAAQLQAIADLMALIAHNEGDADQVLAQARAASETSLPGNMLIRRFERAEALAQAAREQLDLLHARDVPALADFAQALIDYEQGGQG